MEMENETDMLAKFLYRLFEPQLEPENLKDEEDYYAAIREEFMEACKRCF